MIKQTITQSQAKSLTILSPNSYQNRWTNNEVTRIN